MQRGCIAAIGRSEAPTVDVRLGVHAVDLLIADVWLGIYFTDGMN